ncbi:hypothetical protein L1987_43040 [Smallanthus sonchifolius]|uniref:Uncharacterized protein n=1 Tax=Smallanthus sonchifolius TaxID=185202 RepID=A0ACB9GKJ5_9ASTR|nr:hypothetical protein L1987_43040 [Smallanthus sonchifolius]
MRLQCCYLNSSLYLKMLTKAMDVPKTRFNVDLSNKKPINNVLLPPISGEIHSPLGVASVEFIDPLDRAIAPKEDMECGLHKLGSLSFMIFGLGRWGRRNLAGGIRSVVGHAFRED